MREKINGQNTEWRAFVPVLLLVVILVMTIVGTVASWKYTVGETEREQLEDVRHYTTALYDEIERQFAVLDGYSASFTWENIEDHDALLEKLNRCVDNTEFSLACFIYPDGTLYRNDNATVRVPHRYYFQQAMEGNRAVEFLESGINRTARVGMAVPVILDGEPEGVLLGLYEKKDFRTLFERSFSELDSYVYLCDSTGKLILGTEAAEAFLNTHGLRADETANFMAVLEDVTFSSGSRDQVAQQMGSGQSGQAEYAYNGENHFTTYLPLGVNDWYVISVLPENAVYEDALGTAGIFYAVILVAMLAVLTIIIYLFLRARRLAAQEKKKGEEIRYLFEHDALTGVWAEKAFLERVNERLREIQPGEYCLVYLDIYKFKLINDMFGYDKGDELLRATAQGLEELAEHGGGLCGRISGDSFVVFLRHEEEILREFNTKKYKNARIVPVDLYLHYGIYVIQDTSLSADRMVDAAKLAQKTVKGNYDNCVSYYDEGIKERQVKEQEIITSMAKALEEEEFIVYLQPQYNYRSGTISGAEALVRWNSPTKGLISPGIFIPVFETNGFIIPLDEYVWERVCQLQRKWLDEGKAILPVSVNVSRADLLKGGIAEKMMSLVKKYDLTPEALRVEITESAYMDNPQQLILEITRLEACGFIVEMDDFGSGYSSLNTLKDVPIQVLKTDLKFLSATGDAFRKERILRGVIRMAHEMGMEVIAEGVETKEQADYLLELNCEQMQGYYFSRPVPVEEYETMVF